MAGKDSERRPSYVIRETMPAPGSTEQTLQEAYQEGRRQFNVESLKAEARGKLSQIQTGLKAIALDLELARRTELRKKLEKEIAAEKESRRFFNKPYSEEQLKERVDSAVRIPQGEVQRHGHDSWIEDREGKKLPFIISYETWEDEDGIQVRPIQYVQSSKEPPSVRTMKNSRRGYHHEYDNNGIMINFVDGDIAEVVKLFDITGSLDPSTPALNEEIELMKINDKREAKEAYDLGKVFNHSGIAIVPFGYFERSYSSCSEWVYYLESFNPNGYKEDAPGVAFIQSKLGNGSFFTAPGTKLSGHYKFDPEINRFKDENGMAAIDRERYFALMDDILKGIPIF